MRAAAYGLAAILVVACGGAESVVPVNGSREPAAALEAVSGDVRYTEYLGTNHNSWDPTYGSDAFVEWLFAQRKGQR